MSYPLQRQAIELSHLALSERIVLSTICKFWKPEIEQLVFTKINSICAMTRLNERTVRRAIKKLEQLEYIEVTKVRSDKARFPENNYRVDHNKIELESMAYDWCAARTVAGKRP